MTLSKRTVDWNRHGQPLPSLPPVVIVSIVVAVVVIVVVAHCCHRPCRMPPLLSLPPPLPLLPPPPPPPPPPSPSSLLPSLLPLPQQSPPLQPWLIVMFLSPPPPKNLLQTPALIWKPNLIYDQAGNDEKRVVLVGVQTEATGQVTAMVVARIERKPERLCAGDEFKEVGYVVQKGLRARRHLKD